MEVHSVEECVLQAVVKFDELSQIHSRTQFPGFRMLGPTHSNFDMVLVCPDCYIGSIVNWMAYK